MDLLNRLQNISKKNNNENPKCLTDIIKSDFFYLISNYFEVDFDDIDVFIKTENGKYSIEINCEGDRIKLMRNFWIFEKFTHINRYEKVQNWSKFFSFVDFMHYFSTIQTLNQLFFCTHFARTSTSSLCYFTRL